MNVILSIDDFQRRFHITKNLKGSSKVCVWAGGGGGGGGGVLDQKQGG